MIQIPRLPLNDGMTIPVLGLGTAAEMNDEKGEYAQSQLRQLVDVVSHAIKVGYRHFDTAAIYQAERQVGEAIRDSVSKGLVKREELFITTKLWNHRHAPKDVEPALRASLKALNLEYVDLYLMHWPMAYTEDGKILDIDILDTWKAIEKMKDLGLAKSIGVSNFNVAQLTRLLKNCRIRPAVNQIEVNLNLQVPQLMKLCKENDVIITAYTPFGKVIGYRAEHDARVTPADHPVLVTLTKKYNKTVGQILLRFLVQLGITAIPKTVTKSRLEENANIFDFTLTEAEMKSLRALNSDYRTMPMPYWCDHPEYPFEKPDVAEKPSIPKDLLANVV